MIIEGYWEDRQVYYILFSTIENRIFNRCIILPIDYGNKEKTGNLIMTKFSTIKEIIAIDKWEEALKIKL